MWIVLAFIGVGLLTKLMEIGTSLVAKEMETRIERFPSALLTLAARRLPPELRGPVFEEEWLPELYERLRRNEGMPITRVIVGIRFAFGLLCNASKIGEVFAKAGVRLPSAADSRESEHHDYVTNYVVDVAVSSDLSWDARDAGLTTLHAHTRGMPAVAESEGTLAWRQKNIEKARLLTEQALRAQSDTPAD